MILYSDGETLSPGDYLKADRTKYRELRNLLNVAQASLRKLVETSETLKDKALQQENAEGWENLRLACEAALKDQSRDIEIFCWWLAALAYKRSDLSLLEQGLEDFVFAVTTLKEDIHPQLPEKKLAGLDENEAKKKQCDNQTKPLEQLIGDNPNSGLLSIPLMAFPFLDDFALRNYLSEQKAGNLESVKAEFAASLTSRQGELKERFDRIIAIDTSLEKLQEHINNYRYQVSVDMPAGNKLQPLGFTFVRDNIKQIKSMFLYFSPQLEQQEQEQQQAPVEEPLQSGAENQNQTAAPAQVQSASVAATQPATMISSANGNYTREDALADLNRIAIFFKKTEPHNPIPYLLARAIKWGNMSFSELLNELVSKDSPVLAEISKLTGVDSDIGTLLNSNVTMPAAKVEQPKVEAQPKVTEEVKPAPPAASAPEQNQAPQPTPESKSGSLW